MIEFHPRLRDIPATQTWNAYMKTIFTFLLFITFSLQLHAQSLFLVTQKELPYELPLWMGESTLVYDHENSHCTAPSPSATAYSFGRIEIDPQRPLEAIADFLSGRFRPVIKEQSFQYFLQDTKTALGPSLDFLRFACLSGTDAQRVKAALDNTPSEYSFDFFKNNGSTQILGIFDEAFGFSGLSGPSSKTYAKELKRSLNAALRLGHLEPLSKEDKKLLKAQFPLAAQLMGNIQTYSQFEDTSLKLAPLGIITLSSLKGLSKEQQKHIREIEELYPSFISSQKLKTPLTIKESIWTSRSLRTFLFEKTDLKTVRFDFINKAE